MHVKVKWYLKQLKINNFIKNKQVLFVVAFDGFTCNFSFNFILWLCLEKMKNVCMWKFNYGLRHFNIAEKFSLYSIVLFMLWILCCKIFWLLIKQHIRRELIWLKCWKNIFIFVVIINMKIVRIFIALHSTWNAFERMKLYEFILFCFYVHHNWCWPEMYIQIIYIIFSKISFYLKWISCDLFQLFVN